MSLLECLPQVLRYEHNKYVLIIDRDFQKYSLLNLSTKLGNIQRLITEKEEV